MRGGLRDVLSLVRGGYDDGRGGGGGEGISADGKIKEGLMPLFFCMWYNTYKIQCSSGKEVRDCARTFGGQGY